MDPFRSEPKRRVSRRTKFQERQNTANDKRFQREIKAIMNDPYADENEDAQAFIKKCTSASCNKVKAELRSMWLDASDIESAGMVLKAKTVAFKETLTEGAWLSLEQLEDEMKSPTHAMNYSKFAKSHGLEKFDPKRQCKVFYHTKKMDKFGSRNEGEKSWEYKQKEDEQEEISESESNETSSSSAEKKRKKSKKHKRGNSSDSDEKKDKGKKRKKSNNGKKDRKGKGSKDKNPKDKKDKSSKKDKKDKKSGKKDKKRKHSKTDDERVQTPPRPRMRFFRPKARPKASLRMRPFAQFKDASASESSSNTSSSS